MTASSPVQNTTMQIGDVAKRASLTVDAIRFYERRKLLPAAGRSAGRFRLYTLDTIERLRFIQQMRGLGFSLREVGELLALRERGANACESVKNLLESKLADVRSKLRELQQLESELVDDLRKCNRELKHRRQHPPCECPVLKDAAAGIKK
jgi:MerR family mercuric resistance operon transcriptional regulator